MAGWGGNMGGDKSREWKVVWDREEREGVGFRQG